MVKTGNWPEAHIRSVKSVKRKLKDKRYRRRRDDGRACYTVELGAEELSFLIRTQWLAEAEAGDKHAVGRAIGAMVADAARR